MMQILLHKTEMPQLKISEIHKSKFFVFLGQLGELTEQTSRKEDIKKDLIRMEEALFASAEMPFEVFVSIVRSVIKMVDYFNKEVGGVDKEALLDILENGGRDAEKKKIIASLRKTNDSEKLMESFVELSESIINETMEKLDIKPDCEKCSASSHCKGCKS